jgi:[ribosomal protein S5]-alanine N-acetyltransferase
VAQRVPLCIARTPRLLLRQVGLDDADFICTLLNEPLWIRNIGDRGIRTPLAARPYIQEMIISAYARFGFGMYLIERQEDGMPIGLCGLVKRDFLPYPDIGFALLAAFRNRGYACEAATAVIEYARATLGMTVLSGIVRPDNTASVRLLERLGFTAAGAVRPPGEAQDLSLYAVTL